MIKNKVIDLHTHSSYSGGGTDFHGPTVKPDIEIGSGRNNNIKIKELSILNKEDI